MKLSIKGMAIASAVLCGGSIFITAVINRAFPGYGGAYLNLASSLYPGFHPGGMKAGIVGSLYGLLDGAVCGALFAWIYNMAMGKVGSATPAEHQ
jgi:hypothetical protein